MGLMTGISCNYDDEPFHNNNMFSEDRFFWLCELDSQEVNSCFTTIKQNNSIIQINPQMEMKKEVGIINENFNSEDGLVNVYFTDRNIYEGVEYNATVLCSSLNSTEEFSVSIEPYKKDLDSINYRILWIGENIAPLILILIVLGFAYFISKIFPKGTGKIVYWIIIAIAVLMILEKLQII